MKTTHINKLLVLEFHIGTNVCDQFQKQFQINKIKLN